MSPNQEPTRWQRNPVTGIARPVFGITTRCQRCGGNGWYWSGYGAGRHKIDPCGICFGEGFMDRTPGPPK